MSRFPLIVIAAAAALVLAGEVRAAQPSLYASYTPSCTFTWTGDNRAPVTSLAPGAYDVVVTTPFAFGDGLASCLYVQFHLTGPGVDLDTDLGQGDAEIEQLTVTLQPNATYTVQDDGRPAQTRRTFTTASSGTASSGGSASTSAGSSSSTGSVKGTPSVDIAGSAVSLFRGSLDAIVFKNSRLSLTRNGKAVKFLKTGRYTFSVDDESKTAGFTLQSLRGKPKVITSASFVGSHDVTVTLAQGRWFFFAPGGSKRTFFVLS